MTENTTENQNTLFLKIVMWFVWSGALTSVVWGQYRLMQPDPGPWKLFMIAGVVLVIAASLFERLKISKGPSGGWFFTALIISLIILAAIPIKLYNLETIPYGAYNDEMVKGMHALRIMDGEAFKPFHAANKEFLYFYVVIPYLKCLGISFTTVRLVSVTAGVLAVGFLFLLLRMTWGLTTASAAAGLFAVGLWPNTSCHIAERLNFAPLFAVMAIFFSEIAFRSKNLFLWLFAGVVIGAGMWTFPTYRLIPFAIFAYYLFQVFRVKGFLKRSWWRVILMVAALLVTTSLPLDLDIGHTADVFYQGQGHELKMVKGVDQTIQWSKFLVTTFNTQFRGDMSFNLPGQPIIWWPLSVLFLLGLAWLIPRIHKPEVFLLLVWLLAGLLPGVMSEPFARRLTAAQPVIFGIAGVGLVQVIFGLTGFVRWRRFWFLIPVAGLIGATGYHSFHTLTQEISPHWKISFEDFGMVEMALEKMPEYDVRLDDMTEQSQLQYRFLSFPYTGDLDQYMPYIPRDSIPFRFSPEKDVIYLFRNILENRREIPGMQAFYPNSKLTLHKPGDRIRGFYSLEVSKKDIDSIRGIAIRITGSDLNIMDVKYSGSIDINVRDIFPESPEYPVDTTWIGGIQAPFIGAYHFRIKSTAGSQVFIDNKQVFTGNPAGSHEFSAHMTAGLHDFRMVIPGINGNETIRIEWKKPPAPRQRFRRRNVQYEVISGEFLFQVPFPENARADIFQVPGVTQYRMSHQTQYRNEEKNRFQDPSLLKILPDGRIVAANWLNRIMMILDKDGQLLSQWDPNVLNDHRFQLRYFFDIGPDGLIYLIGSRNQGVLVLDLDGNLIRKFAIPPGEVDIACTSDGDVLLLAYSSVHRLSNIDGSLIEEIKLVSDDPEERVAPRDMALDSEGNMIFCDDTLRKILIYRADGTFTGSFTIPGPMGDTYAMTVDESGRIFLPNVWLDRIFVFNYQGQLLTGRSEFDFDILDSIKIHHARSVAIAGNDDIWISNSGKGIFLMKPYGTVNETPSGKISMQSTSNEP